jgi:hypothetical protein
MTEQYVRSIAELSSALGLAKSTLMLYRTEGMPGRDEKGWDVEATRAWIAARVDRRKQRAPGRNPAGGATLDGASGAIDIRHEEALFRRRKNELLELDLRKRKRELLERDDVERDHIARMLFFRRSLLGLARRISTEIAGKDQQQVHAFVLQEAKDILRGIATASPLPWLDEVPDDVLDGEAPIDPATGHVA